MAIDSCIQNVGEYYSSHYLDTIFANDLTGLITKWKEEGTASTPAKIKRLAQKYFKAKARAIELSIEKRNEDDEINSFHSELLEALGYKEYQGEEFLVEGDTSYIPVKANFTRHNALYLTICETFFTLPENSLPEKKGSEEPLELFPLASTVISNEREKSILQNNDSVKQDRPLTVGQFEVTGGHLPLADGDWEKLIGKIFTAEESPRWVLFLAGTFIYLFNKTTYSQGRYLLFNLDDAFGKNTQDASNQLAAFLSYETLCPEGESEILHERLEQQSHKFAYGVTEKLQQSVREAIELLANEWIEARKRKKLSYNSLSPEEKKGYLNSNVKEDKLEVSAENLKNEALTFAYRLLFCFYAESRGEELGILPVDSDQYLKGYSLEALRDLEQVPLTSQSEMGVYFHEHLSILFQIIYKGFNASSRDGVLIAPENKVFQIQPLTASLFAPEYTPLFNTVKFPNHVWQKVLVRLSLAKHEKSKSIGRVNYAELGVNQLGAVYEGLLSYQGMFAKEDLIHVKSKDGSFGDNSTQTYFVSADRSKEFSKEEIETEDKRVKIYKKGAFILHLNSIDREKSASHYTPYVLTKSLVEESLRELLKDFKPTDADSILAFKLCEPAMGSGAFIEEMANQLASAYLKLKQEELKVYIEPANYTDEHRRVKHFIVTRNVYGVDLNPTAVELGALSLWLGSSHKLLVKKGENGERDKYQSAATPWFGLRLRAGNSLIGARRAVWTREQLKQGEHLEQNTNPRLLKPGEERQKDEFYHFLVFDNQMIPLAYEKEAKEYYPKEIEIARKWIAESVRKRWEDEDLNRLRDISDSIDKHWNDYLLERLSALEKTQCTATVFPTPSNSELALAKGISLEEQEEVKRNLESASGSFQRLKLLLDTFCALYFWDLSAVNSLPSRDEFLVSAELLLRNVVVDKNTLAFYKMRLGTNIEVLLHSSNMHIPSTDDLESALSYYEVSRKIAEEEKFLHWELVFPEIFVKRILNGEFLILNEGASSIHNSKLKIHNSFGFDLINGNPPWIKVGWEEAVALGEIDPKLGVKGAKSAEFTKAKLSLLKEKEARKKYLNEFRRSIGTVTFLNSRNLYPELAGVQTNVYKNFIVRSWALLSARGIVGLLHPNSVFDDPNGGTLRKEYYQRLRAVYQFKNSLLLFKDVHDQLTYCANISGSARNGIYFKLINNLFSPDTISKCYSHSTPTDPISGIKDDEGNWSVRGHCNRIIHVTEKELQLFQSLFEEANTDYLEAKLPQIHSQEILKVLQRFTTVDEKFGDYKKVYGIHEIFHESNSQRDGLTIRRENPTYQPKKPEQVVLSGPHIFVGNPLNKNPNKECLNSAAYSDIDFTVLKEEFLPRTLYEPGLKSKFKEAIPDIEIGDKKVSILEFPNFVFRKMCQAANERTLIGAITPSGYTGIAGVLFLVMESSTDLVAFAGACFSVPYDFFIKVKGRNNVIHSDLKSLPFLKGKYVEPIVHRALRLNCLTVYYADLWKEVATKAILKDCWTSDDIRLVHEFEDPWKKLNPAEWTWRTPLRSDFARRQALVEIDVLVALSLGLTVDELIAIYRVQFPVLRGYEKVDRYDARGRRIPNTTRKDPGGKEFREEEEGLTTKSTKDTKGGRGRSDESSPLPLGEGATRNKSDKNENVGERSITITWSVDNGNQKVTKTYYPPFRGVDREEDYRVAYEKFAKR